MITGNTVKNKKFLRIVNFSCLSGWCPGWDKEKSAVGPSEHHEEPESDGPLLSGWCGWVTATVTQERIRPFSQSFMSKNIWLSFVQLFSAWAWFYWNCSVQSTVVPGSVPAMVTPLTALLLDSLHWPRSLHCLTRTLWSCSCPRTTCPLWPCSILATWSF